MSPKPEAAAAGRHGDWLWHPRAVLWIVIPLALYLVCPGPVIFVYGCVDGDVPARLDRSLETFFAPHTWLADRWDLYMGYLLWCLGVGLELGGRS